MRSSLPVFASAVLLFFSCTKDEPEPVPTYIQAVTDTHQFGYAGETLAEPAAVQILDGNRKPMNGINVNFQVQKGNVSLYETETLTDANGIAYAYLTFEEPGNVIVEASAGELSEKVLFTFSVSSGRASRITISFGHEQEGLFGTTTAQKLRVRVTDDFENVSVDVPVKFLVIRGDGTSSPEVVSTNEEGIAETGFKLSSTETINTIYAITSGDTAVFTLYSLFPSNLLTPTKTKDAIRLKWERSRNEGFSHYTLLKADARFPTVFNAVATIENLRDTTFEDSNVRPGYDYLYTVTSHTAKGSSIPSETHPIEFGEYIALEARGHDLEIDNARKAIYVSVPSKNSIHIINQETQQITDRIFVGSQPSGIDLSEDNASLYVALSGTGDVAIVNLDSHEVELVDVEGALNDVRASDVLEAAPGRVFVSANPQQYGISYIAVVKTAMNNTVERFFGEILRFNPLLQADYGNELYILNEDELYRLDPYGVYSGSSAPSFTFSSKRNHLCVSPEGNGIYFDLEVLNRDLQVTHQLPFGMPVISSDGTVVHYLSYHTHSASIRSYSTSDYALLNEIVLEPGTPRQMKVTADDSTFYILTSNLEENRIIVVHKN